MPSLRARLATGLTKLLFRRRDWGDETALARRSRRLVGAPKLYARLRSRGLKIEPVRDGTLTGEWITPPDPQPGAIFYLHGGGYTSGSAERHRPITAGLARRTRQRVFSLDYRLGPDHRFPAAFDDALGAWQFLHSNADPIAIAGDSAGGGLALATMVACRQDGFPMPACAVLFSPWTDLTGTGESIRQNAGKCAMFYPDNIRQFASAYLGNGDARNLQASPIFADLRGLPPILLQVSSSELLLDDSRRLYSQLIASDGSATLQVYDNVMHCWQMLDGLVPEAGQALDAAAEFLSNNR